MSKVINFEPIKSMVADELHGTGLAFVLVVWRPGLPGGADSIAVVSDTGPNDEQADVLRMAAEK